MQSGRSMQQGFTLIELVITMTLTSILMAFAVTSFTSVIQDTRFKAEVSDIEGLIRRTMNECLARGSSGLVVIGQLAADNDPSASDTTLRGFLLDEDDNMEEISRMDITNTRFTREFGTASPWLGDTGHGKPGNFEDNVILITPTGTLEASGVIYLQYQTTRKEAVIEVLANGMVDTFFDETIGAGEAVWVR